MTKHFIDLAPHPCVQEFTAPVGFIRVISRGTSDAVYLQRSDDTETWFEFQFDVKAGMTLESIGEKVELYGLSNDWHAQLEKNFLDVQAGY